MSNVVTAKNCNPANAHLFFGTSTVGAVELCLDCPVMVKCQRWARRNGEIHGVWGAETARERCAWLVENHPDPEVVVSAQIELDEWQRQREKQARRRGTASVDQANVHCEQKPIAERRPARRRSTAPTARAKERAIQARRMRAAGVSIADIATDLGISPSSVERYLGAKYSNNVTHR